jgi:calcineurin-like phosphoesterase
MSSSFYKSNSFWNTTTFTVPTLDGHLTNKLYVDGSIATAVATETASILADDNVFTGLNSFTQDLGTTGINTGNLVMDTEASEIRWNSKQEFMIQDYFTANNRFVIRGTDR